MAATLTYGSTAGHRHGTVTATGAVARLVSAAGAVARLKILRHCMAVTSGHGRLYKHGTLSLTTVRTSAKLYYSFVGVWRSDRVFLCSDEKKLVLNDRTITNHYHESKQDRISSQKHGDNAHDIKLQMREDVCKPKLSVPESHGGVLTSKFGLPTSKMQARLPKRMRKELKVDGFPKFDGCSDWIKPIMYREYQVNRVFK
jgi:hypothetical protein